VVESDGKNWATTTVNFMPMGRRPTVQVYLQPYRSSKPAHGGAVSAADLRQDVPRAARKAYEAAVEVIQKKGYELAKPHLERAIELFPDFVEARNELAVARMKGGDVAGAEILLRRAIAIDPAAPRPQMNLGLCLYRQGLYAQAAAPLERAIQLEPGNYRSHLLLGITLVMAGDDPRAEPTLLKAYELGGTSAARAQYYLARFYTRKKQYDRAARALETYLADAPADPYAGELRTTLVKLRAAVHR
jgi:Flp pilus assembly protein TadD